MEKVSIVNEKDFLDYLDILDCSEKCPSFSDCISVAKKDPPAFYPCVMAYKITRILNNIAWDSYFASTYIYIEDFKSI